MGNGFWYVIKGPDGKEYYRGENATEVVLRSIEVDKTLPETEQTRVVVVFKSDDGVESKAEMSG